ncbi:MAG: DUF6377 domain-containing protein [Tannerellaceae bacterium]|nr:DUF6377 domain-containing protein [Tannerellaceae bacterium]MCD8265457.1 DUF6377 domain-containing protein [Tannerellaceae bacterium]
MTRTTTNDKKFNILFDIITEYQSYICDSALAYIEKNLALAEKAGNNEWLYRTKLQYSFVLSSSGLFRESKENIRTIPAGELSGQLLIDYYKMEVQLLENYVSYINDSRFGSKYQPEIEALRDSILYYLPADDVADRKFYQYVKYFSTGEMNLAEEELLSYFKAVEPGTHEYARICASLSGFYSRKGDKHNQVKYVILSAISDIQDAVKENTALMWTAVHLYETKDFQRAYTYIQSALEDANFYNTRLRNAQISRFTPLITEAYQQENEWQQQMLKKLLTTVSFLFLILLAIAVFIYIQMKALRRARTGMKKANEELKEMNGKLTLLNHELSEANAIKEGYISHFMDLCSEYIGKLEEYRKMIHNNIASKRFDELFKLTASARGKANEVKELYDNFDKAFLSIYPGFVEEFNELLKPEEHFDNKKGELLNTELRVFALIRLGISDSAKIASFLRCSLQTAYNYRSKIKRKAIHETDDIEEQIRRIGTIGS